MQPISFLSLVGLAWGRPSPSTRVVVGGKVVSIRLFKGGNHGILSIEKGEEQLKKEETNTKKNISFNPGTRTLFLFLTSPPTRPCPASKPSVRRVSRSETTPMTSGRRKGESRLDYDRKRILLFKEVSSFIPSRLCAKAKPRPSQGQAKAKPRPSQGQGALHRLCLAMPCRRHGKAWQGMASAWPKPKRRVCLRHGKAWHRLGRSLSEGHVFGMGKAKGTRRGRSRGRGAARVFTRSASSECMRSTLYAYDSTISSNRSNQDSKEDQVACPQVLSPKTRCLYKGVYNDAEKT